MYRLLLLPSGTQSLSTSTSRRIHSSNSPLSKLWAGIPRVDPSPLPSPQPAPCSPPRGPARAPHRQAEAQGRAQHPVHVEPGSEEAHALVAAFERLHALKELRGQMGG